MYMYINLKGFIQFTEIWLNLRILCASLSALTLNIDPCTIGVSVLTLYLKIDPNQWAWQGSTVGPSLYYPCLVQIQVQYNNPPPMLHDGMYMPLYFIFLFKVCIEFVKQRSPQPRVCLIMSKFCTFSVKWNNLRLGFCR